MMKQSLRLLTTALLTILLLVTSSTSYAAETKSAADENAEDTDGPMIYPLTEGEAPISIMTSPDHPNALKADVFLQDLTDGISYDINDFVIRSGHIYRITLQLYSDGEPVRDVKLVAQLPNTDSDNMIRFEARDALTAQPLTSIRIFFEAENDAPMPKINCLKDSWKTTFLGHITDMNSYEIEQLLDVKCGLSMGDVYSLESYSRMNYIPETVAFDFEAKTPKFKFEFKPLAFVLGLGIGFGTMSIIGHIKRSRRQKANDTPLMDDTEEETSD